MSAGSRRSVRDRRYSWSGETKASSPTFGGMHIRRRAPAATWGAWSTRTRGMRVELGERWLIAADFRKARLGEVIGGAGEKEEGADLKPRRPIYSPLWQADGKRIRRVAPLDFIGRFMPRWFDYAICDEAHQLANDTAQGNGLGTLAACADRTVILTGTLLGGYASDVYNLLFRLEAGKMAAHGYEWGEAGAAVLRRNLWRVGKGYDHRAGGQQLLEGARH